MGTIQSNMRVDGIVTGACTIFVGLETKHQVIALLAKGKFILGKWAANNS